MIGDETYEKIAKRHCNFNRIPLTKELFKILKSCMVEAVRTSDMEKQQRDNYLKKIRRTI